MHWPVKTWASITGTHQFTRGLLPYCAESALPRYDEDADRSSKELINLFAARNSCLKLFFQLNFETWFELEILPHSRFCTRLTMRITRHRTAWGVEAGENLANWAQWFPQLKKHGYSKCRGTTGQKILVRERLLTSNVCYRWSRDRHPPIEPSYRFSASEGSTGQSWSWNECAVSLLSINWQQWITKQLRQISAHSSWFMYAGPRPAGLQADHHLKNYRDILQSTAPLRPVAINFQSGQ